MPVTYDKYYQTENLFGEPYPELIEFFAEYPRKGKVLDFDKRHKRLADKEFKYVFEDSDSGHKSETDYRMIVIEK